MVDPRNNIPTVLIILGATGNLAAKKIFPALFHLDDKGLLPDHFEVIGHGRSKLNEEGFRNHVFKNLKKYGGVKTQKQADKFLSKVTYEQGNLSKLKDHQSLALRIDQIDQDWGICSNKLFYVAVPQEIYEKTFENLADSGLTDPCSPEEGWTRVLVEKPIGKDSQTANRVDKLLGKLFKEEQIYRIDHYLAKEMLQNILSFRFSNNLFEETWNNKFIEKIDITALEKLDLKGRGYFYDGLGALRDVGQNHLLQMLALTTMDHPESFDTQSVRKGRAELLKTLIAPDKKDVKELTYRSQYKGYEKLKDVKKNSKTETYFKVGLYLNHPRWQGVPITIESGKVMSEVKKQVKVTFKHPSPCLCPPGSDHFKNTVTFSMEPEEEIKVQFWSKKPGIKYEIEEKDLVVRLRDISERLQYIEEYEKLLLDCISGDQTLFVTTQEVDEMWRFTDPIVNAWDKNGVPLKTYTPYSKKPVQEALMIDQRMLEAAIIPESKYTKNRQIGIVGLGKMGTNMAKRLHSRGWDVIGYNRTDTKTKALEKEGIINGAYSNEELVDKLKSPRIIWLMVPAGEPVDETLFGKHGIAQYLEKGDIVIDGGNSYFKDTVSRYKKLKKKGIHLIDAGVSGGPSGALHGSTIMIGGSQEASSQLEPLFHNLAQENGYQFFNEPGSGHFVKMVHNGIEYGMMQSLAEGFNIMKNASYKLNMADIARVYNEGSVIESRLVGWLHNAFQVYGENLKGVSSTVEHTGEGAWTVDTAKEMKIKAKVIEESLNFRKMSAKNPSYAGKVLSALRNQFGGHSIKEK